jgi:hypothetical protein
MRSFLPCLLLCALLPGSAFAEPPRQVEVFGTVGVARQAGDEGSQGSGATLGGAATIPLAARWAIDVQALTVGTSNYANSDVRSTFLSPGIQYRRGNENAYWFIAGGPGLALERLKGSYQVPTGTVSFDETTNAFTLHWRTGAVYRPTGRLLVRGEFFWVSRYVLPTVGAAVSIGVRLGR